MFNAVKTAVDIRVGNKTKEEATKDLKPAEKAAVTKALKVFEERDKAEAEEAARIEAMDDETRMAEAARLVMNF